jgi:uncharacterized membrane protein YqjE
VFEAIRKSKQISLIALDRLGDYIELLRIEMKLQGRELGMMLLSSAIGAVFGLLAVLFAGIAIIITWWDSPYRALAAWAVVLLYGGVAGFGFSLARKHKPGSALSTLRDEIKRDAALVRESL